MGSCTRLVGMIGVLALSLGFLGGCDSGPSGPVKPQANGKFSFWPVYPDEPRVQFVRAFNGSTDLSGEGSTFDKLVFGQKADDTSAIKKPYGIAYRDGKIYICDIRDKSLTILDLRKKQTRLVGSSGITPLNHPVDVAIADDGMIYVADNAQGAVVVYSADERYAMAFGRPNFKPISVAVSGDKLYVCDMPTQVVEILDRHTGKQIGTIGAVGDEDGQFRLPLCVRTDKAGDVFVVDMMRCRVQKFSADGRFLKGVGTLGDYAGAFVRPKHMAVDSDGIVYVVDAAFQNVQMFNNDLELLMSFGAAGSFPGAMNLPVGVCTGDTGLDMFKDFIHPGFNAKRLVIVANQFGGSKIAVYALGERDSGYPLADLQKSANDISQGVGASPDQLRMGGQGAQPEPVPEGESPAGAPAAPGQEPAPKTEAQPK